VQVDSVPLAEVWGVSRALPTLAAVGSMKQVAE
jgi:hypothetical protein